MQTLRQDHHYGARMLVKQPGFTLLAHAQLRLRCIHRRSQPCERVSNDLAAKHGQEHTAWRNAETLFDLTRNWLVRFDRPAFR